MMRICLLSLSYPPQDTEGISRQRYTLAIELARSGNDVHVVTPGAFSHIRRENGVAVHRVAINRLNTFDERYPWLNRPLTKSQALYEGLQASLDQTSYDIVDIPLWGAQGITTQLYYTGATVIWLQTTLAQILEMHGRSPGEDEKVKLALEKICLERASGLLADSNSVLDSVHQHYAFQTNAPAGVSYLGLPPRPTPPERQLQNGVEALVVGRLEKRKGTPLIFEILPNLLKQHPQLTIRFVGRDNSQSDGWQALHHTSYPAYFQQRYPHLADRVFFDGYVSEERLQECYSKANLFLAPSLYESFGLTYLEAMRVGLPVITFSTGAATEIFAAGGADGAVLVPAENGNDFAAAISELVESPQLRRDLGQAGLGRFQAAFTAQAMAKSTLEFYQHVLTHHSKAHRDTPKIYQVMEALDYGDAVSKIAINNAGMLAELGQPKEILTRYADESVRCYTVPRSTILSDMGCSLIFHYWGYNHSTWMLPFAKGRKALYYHNITPPHFFSPDSAAFRLTSQGYAQLGRILDHFDLLIGDSQYNLQSLAPFLSRPTPALHIYPVVDPDRIKALPYDETLFARLRSTEQVNILFVGRIARNKRQDRLMQAFDHYFREIEPRAHLRLVGSETSDPAYRAELEELRISLVSRDNIHFTGKITNLQIRAYYRAADIFLSASEHEGFGMPLIEAMAFDVPVIAYAATAVPETMGNARTLIDSWDDQRVADLVRNLNYNRTLRKQLVAEQRLNLNRFSVSEVVKRLQLAIEYLQTGKKRALIQPIEPRFTAQ